MRIKDILQLKHMRQQDLADKMCVSLSAVKQMLNAESLTTTTLNKIADALGVPMWQLFASPQEVCAGSDFFAVVKRGNDVRTFDSADSLKAFCESL